MENVDFSDLHAGISFLFSFLPFGFSFFYVVYGYSTVLYNIYFFTSRNILFFSFFLFLSFFPALAVLRYRRRLYLTLSCRLRST